MWPLIVCKVEHKKIADRYIFASSSLFTHRECKVQYHRARHKHAQDNLHQHDRGYDGFQQISTAQCLLVHRNDRSNAITIRRNCSSLVLQLECNQPKVDGAIAGEIEDDHNFGTSNICTDVRHRYHRDGEHKIASQWGTNLQSVKIFLHMEHVLCGGVPMSSPNVRPERGANWCGSKNANGVQDD